MPEQQAIEMILLRQLASYLTIPIWLMDGSGNLLYYNKPAEETLGAAFDEVGPIHAEDLTELFKTSDIDEPEGEMPVVSVFETRTPDHGRVRFRGLDGVWREVEVTAIPVEGQAGRLVGVLALFWESPA